MNTRVKQLLFAVLATPTVATFALLPTAQAGPHRLDADGIGRAAGVKATTKPDGVVRLEWPRKDVKVTVDGMPFNPAAGLGSWAAFKAAPHGAMVMGDTVVFQDEVTPAMDAAFAHHLEVTALHNHFFFDEPKVYYMHIGGRGDPEKLAAGVKAVWDSIKKVRAEHKSPLDRFPGKVPAPGTINAEAIAGTLGHKAETNAGVVKVTVAREGSMHGVKVAGTMGLTTWAAFSGSDELAAVDGDFIMTAQEVQPVLRALRKSGIHIVALHNHMVGEQPAFYFTHFWGKGSVNELATGLKSALDAQAKVGKGNGGRGLRLKPPDLHSGPNVGTILPGTFNALSVIHAERDEGAGKKWDYVEQYGTDPAVLVFARTVNDPLVQLIKRLDAEVAKRTTDKRKLHALQVIMSDDEGLETTLKDIAERHNIKHVSLAIDSQAGPTRWNLAREADPTIILYSRRKVEANHSFTKGELNEHAIAAIVADLPRIVAK
jgi:hypothetical protein